MLSGPRGMKNALYLGPFSPSQSWSLSRVRSFFLLNRKSTGNTVCFWSWMYVLFLRPHQLPESRYLLPPVSVLLCLTFSSPPKAADLSRPHPFAFLYFLFHFSSSLPHPVILHAGGWGFPRWPFLFLLAQILSLLSTIVASACLACMPWLVTASLSRSTADPRERGSSAEVGEPHAHTFSASPCLSLKCSTYTSSCNYS